MKALDLSAGFESGQEYRFEGERLHVFGKDTVHLTDPVYRSIYPSEKTWLDTAVYLHGLSDVVLDFGGVVLTLHDDTIQPFVLHDCQNVTIRNVTVEYERSMMDEMDVADVRDGELWLRQTEKQKKYFPIKAEDGRLIPVSGDKEYKHDFEEPHFLNFYDKKTRMASLMCLVRIGKDLRVIPHEEFPFSYCELTAEQRGEYIVLQGDLPAGIPIGSVAAQTHSARDISSCLLIGCRNVRLENYRILNGAGMGILGMYSENITLDRLLLQFDERSHGFASNAADAVHLFSCFGRVELLNSVLEGMKDDALNIHGNYYCVDSAEGNVIHARLKTDIQKDPALNAHCRMFGAGDRIAVYQGSTMIERQNCIVQRAEVTGDFTADLYVSGDVSSLREGDTVENLSAQADLHIENCRFGKAKTHLRLQTRGKILLENCECALKILLSGDKNYWYEGSPVTDLTIQNCTFVGKNARIEAVPEFTATPEFPWYHSGIRVVGNVFDAETALHLSGCRDVVFENNVHRRGRSFKNVIR